MKPGKIIPKRISRALMEYELIKKGDRVLLALSGGKDSMTMAWFLSSMASSFPENFSVEAVHVTAPWEEEKLPLWISRTCKDWHIPLTLLPLDNQKIKRPGCHSCSRLRRKALLTFGAEKGFNRIALGHHMEDCLTTYLINLVYQP